ncbi:alpha/beta hydrolase [Paenibacillus sediminis]|uniref:Pimeloyl-ACP methyl ester carboxylesterase n=1 Tax=Paenibacillus sediminis TaxID=664909 RepID=A0ABS4H3T5_9BACL|nr:alpha/beta hydrolase [Paenibacillus sediminis]MBP1937194.1 pimeloyl-ACP methyl ester carboxylesterase [Paenibacillus sediminis]
MQKTIYRKKEGESLFKEAYDRTLQEWDVPYGSSYVNTRFGRTHVIAAGPKGAEPLVLLHGFGFSSTMWKDNIKDLSEQYRVYALDFVGDINRSVATKQIESKADCANWFSDVLDELHLHKANVMGMSYGGFLALVFAILLPNRVDKLITICPGASLQKQKKQFFLRSLHAGIFPSAQNIDRFIRYMSADASKIDSTIRYQFIVAMQNCIPRIKVFASYLTDDELQKIEAPTLLLIGNHEVQYNPNAAIERAGRFIPKLDAHLIKDAGHGVTLEQPQVVDQHVLQFLQK